MNQKYQYQGTSLYKYCNEHSINKFTIYSRIKKFRSENPNLSNEELIKESLTRDLSKENASYLWNNTTLYKYCKNNKEINYESIRSWLSLQLKQNPKASIDELITNYINGINRKNRWFYLGIPLRKFCDNNNILYKSIKSYLFTALRSPKFTNWSDDELVAYLVERRFLINGKTLRDYCNSINFSYEIMHEILKEKLKTNPDIKFKTILMSTINTIMNYYLTNYETIKHYPEEMHNYLKDSTNKYLRNNFRNNESTLTLMR